MCGDFPAECESAAWAEGLRQHKSQPVKSEVMQYKCWPATHLEQPSLSNSTFEQQLLRRNLPFAFQHSLFL
jgi:hypothetical protein